jgi:transposase InsO family protein
MKSAKALAICGLSKHQYYYKNKGGKAGRKPSTTTPRLVEGQVIECPNREVLTYMREVLANPLADYGYHRMTGQLCLAGFYINHKKVYRLMGQAHLLQPVKTKASKQYVKYRVVSPEGPLRLLEMDIKMVWLERIRRYAYVLTILDVFTRVVLHWERGLQMRQTEVEQAWRQVIQNHLEPHGALAWEMHIEIRSDNGPQFCAVKLRKFFQDNYLVQTFTHPYTPQENGHVESFHAILDRALEGQYFADLPDLDQYLVVFYQFYNYGRIHGSTVKLPPMTFWQQWLLGNIERKMLDEKARKVRFALKVPRQEISPVKPVDNGSRREVSSLDLVGLDARQIQKNEPLDGPADDPAQPIIMAQPAA